MGSRRIEIPMNRVEGDLEVAARVEDGVVADAWCSGTLYRGFERGLVGRGSLDGLVLTPRVCGICSTSHLAAAAMALEDLGSVRVPPDAMMLRNVALVAELLQSDLRQHVLLFAPDWLHPTYADDPLAEEARQRYAPLQGQVVRQAVVESRVLLDIVALIGGQWPHSTFMVPGGVTHSLDRVEQLECRQRLRRYREYYEEHVVGATLEELGRLRRVSQLEDWLTDERAARSELGFLLRWGLAHGWESLGRSEASLVGFGSMPLPRSTAVRGRRRGDWLIPGGVAAASGVGELDAGLISEHIASSWYTGYTGGRHPLQGLTQPLATGREGGRYSWAKAPRYDGQPAETGPLAELVIVGHHLLSDAWQAWGSSVLSRQLARLVRGAELLNAAEIWLEEIDSTGETYTRHPDLLDGEGAGMVSAARGALGHWLRLEEGRITHYQMITPTAWNASPRDTDGVPGPMESALEGTAVPDVDEPIVLGHVVRSYDPCLVCAVHTLQGPRSRGRLRLGV